VKNSKESSVTRLVGTTALKTLVQEVSRVLSIQNCFWKYQHKFQVLDREFLIIVPLTG